MYYALEQFKRFPYFTIYKLTKQKYLQKYNIMNQNLVYNMRTILRAKNDFTVYKDTTRRTKN